MFSTSLIIKHFADKQWDLYIKESDLLINSSLWENMPTAVRLSWLNDRAIAFIELSQPERALAECDAAKAIGHKFYELHTTRSRANSVLEKYEEAIADAELAIEVDWRRADAYLLRCSARMELGNHEEALADIDMALKINPENCLAYVYLSTAMRALKQHSEAISAAEQLTILAPNNPEAFAYLANERNLAGKLSEGLMACNQAIEIDPNCVNGYSCRVQAKIGLGDFTGALADINKVISLFPDERTHYGGMAYGSRAFIHAKLGHEQEALEDSNKALELDPNNSEMLRMRGPMLGALRRWDEAISTVQAALANTKYPEICHASLAGYYAMAGDVESAMKHTEIALELDSDNFMVYNNRAWIRAHLGEGEEALADVERAISMAPEILPSLFGTKGIVYYALGRYEDALVDLEKAIAVEATRDEAYYFRAQIYGRLQESQKAAADLEKARQLKYELPPFSKLSISS
jgi:tetratricopeptide (TPR) repeat protein